MRDVAQGFFDGVLSVFRGIGFIARTRRAWLPSAVPALVLVALSAAAVVVALQMIAPAVMARVTFPPTWFGRAAAATLRILVAVLTAGAGVLLSATFAPALSGPALERIIVLREEDLGLPPRPRVSLFVELWCGLRAQLLALAVGAPLLAALWFVTILVPPSAVVTFR